MNKYDGVLFDMDGVLIDSMPLHLKAFNQVLERYSVQINSADISGRKTYDILSEVSARYKHSRLDVPYLVNQKQKIASKLIEEAGHSIMMNDSLDVLRELIRIKKVGICTSGSRASLNHYLRMVPKDLSFDIALCSEDVSKAKPNPEIYTKGVKELELNSRATLVVEDSIAGAMAGTGAGCDVALLDPNRSLVFQENSLLFRITSLQQLLV